MPFIYAVIPIFNLDKNRRKSRKNKCGYPHNLRLYLFFHHLHIPASNPPVYAMNVYFSTKTPRCKNRNGALNPYSISIEFRQTVQAFLNFFVGGNVIAHFAVVEFFIAHHIEISCARQAEQNRLFFTRLLAF